MYHVVKNLVTDAGCFFEGMAYFGNNNDMCTTEDPETCERKENPEECQKLCQETDGCVAFTWDGKLVKSCLLKNVS